MSTTALAVAEPQQQDGTRAISAFSTEQNFIAAQRMAKALSSSSLVPREFQGPKGMANCMIALELASRVGASVLMVCQNLDIIHGRPSWRAQFLIATANASGRFSPLRFEFEGRPGSDAWGCRAVAQDLASGADLIGPLVTMGMAKAEGWAGKAGSKWQTMPELMLRYRAGAFWVRTICPEIAMGLYTTDELLDISGRGGTRQVQTEAVPASDSGAILEAELLDEPAPPTPRSGEPEREPGEEG